MLCLRHLSKISIALPTKIVMHCSYSTQPTVLVTEDKGVRNIVMNDQKTRNALSISMMNDLLATLNKDRDSLDLRCIVLRSSHPQVFSSGHNLKHMALDSTSTTELEQIYATCSQLMLCIMNHPVPVIALVQGIAAAAGCQLVASCDVTLATANSKFSTPGARHGIFCSTPAVALTRKIPFGLVRSMTITGIPISAQEAFTAGLVAKVVPTETELDEELSLVTSSILNNSRSILSLGKQFLLKQMNLSIEQAYKFGADTMVHNLCMKDGVEGMKAFSEKRHPHWSHSEEMFPVK